MDAMRGHKSVIFFYVLSKLLQIFAVAFYGYMNTVVYQFSEEIPLHVRFHNTACKVDGKYILKAYNGTV